MTQHLYCAGDLVILVRVLKQVAFWQPGAGLGGDLCGGSSFFAGACNKHTATLHTLDLALDCYREFSVCDVAEV